MSKWFDDFLDSPWKFPVTLVSAVFVVMIAAWVISSHFEAKAYNRVTGADISTVEAMFIELRVQEGADR